MSEDINSAVETKRSAVTFKIPDSDDRLGKSVGDITAGKLSVHKNIQYVSIIQNIIMHYKFKFI